MSQRIVIDPMTRIEGHLKIDAEVEGGRVKDAWSAGTMWRGIEVILQGRDPREAWLFTQRICGVCTTVHAVASVRAVENALKLEIPKNANLIRNIIIAAHALHDHIVHFYHLSALDWVDIVSALSGDPKEAASIADSVSEWPGNSARRFAEVKDRLAAFAGSGQLGPFTNGYWGHPAMKLPPAVNLMAAAHYLEALEYQRKANQIVAILGSKSPHIQNLAVGGVANPINLDNQAALNMEKLMHVKELIDEIGAFVKQVYLVDVAAVGAMYADWLKYGAGVKNYLSVPDLPMDTKGEKFWMPGGYVENGDLAAFKPIKSFNDPYFKDGVKESIKYSWYDGDWTRHPWDETTEPNYQESGTKYSWIKAPTFCGKPAQVGPLANVMCLAAAGHEPTKKYLDQALALASKLAGVQVTVPMLHSTIGRHAARAVRAAVMHDGLADMWQQLVDNIASGDTAIYNKPEFPAGEQKGFGFHEAPRGMLSHWVVIDSGKIKNYQCVVPSTWNLCPRNGEDSPGPVESSIKGNPIADPVKPLEVLRTVHSFDPCIACAIHVIDAKGDKISTVNTGL
jgi:hydrogenase large subunit